MSNIVWNAVKGWHDGEKVALKLKNGRIVSNPHIIEEIEHRRMVDGVAMLISQNIWTDGGVSYSLFDDTTGELLSNEDFGIMPTDPEVRPFLKTGRE